MIFLALEQSIFQFPFQVALSVARYSYITNELNLFTAFAYPLARPIEIVGIWLPESFSVLCKVVILT